MEEVSASFNAQANAPDRQLAPCIFVEKPRHCSPVPPRSPTKHDIPTISLQLDSPDCAQELFKRILISSYLDGQRIEFQCCLRIRFVRIGVVCFHSVGPGCSWISSVITFVDHRGSTIFVSMYILFA